MRAGSLFSGQGQLDFGLCLAGIEHAWFCEADPWRREILERRWPGVPVFDDVRAVDGSVPGVDLLVGGFPCRGASTAGGREGMGNPETALWREMARIARELRPRYLLLENVANLLAVTGGRAWGEVVGDLAALGYVGGWDCLPAAAFGAPHLRDRVFAIAALAHAGEGRRGEGERDLRQGQPDAQGLASADPDGHPLREQPEPERGSDGAAEFGRSGSTPTDPTRPDGQGAHGGRETLGRAPGDDGSRDWGSYAGAIERWEEVSGPAPEPLLRGLDARDARSLVRSQLSAYGDGVHLGPAVFLGTRLRELWEEGQPK